MSEATVALIAGLALGAGAFVLERHSRSLLTLIAFAALCAAAAAMPLLILRSDVELPVTDVGFWLYNAALLSLAVLMVRRLAASDADSALARLAVPAGFGLWVVVFWQILAQALDVPRVLLPAPSYIAGALADNWDTLLEDFDQTVLHAMLLGYALGGGAGFATGILLDRSVFLQRGLLPISALASTVPLVGIAPIMVMWFGFDWPSKAAVVAVMTFFPMLVATLAGLRAAGKTELDLMRSYAAGYWRTLRSLRLPAAWPFVFNGLKINSTLALIGAIVAEFFGSPTVGLGFRISSEVAHLNMALVWAAIVVAALTGSLFYAMLSLIERGVTFWHPSQRG